MVSVGPEQQPGFPMSPSSSTPEFQCPKCGATSALWLPDPNPPALVTLKCLACASLVRLPRDKVVASRFSDSNRAGTSI